jgi:hypothetical protein
MCEKRRIRIAFGGLCFSMLFAQKFPRNIVVCLVETDKHIVVSLVGNSISVQHKDLVLRICRKYPEVIWYEQKRKTKTNFNYFSIVV